MTANATALETRTAPSTPAAGAVRLLARADDRLEIRFYDAVGRFRRWLMPRQHAAELATWWNQEGHNWPPGGAYQPQSRRGRILVSVLSATQLYIRGCDDRGRSNITGYQFPRVVVEAIATNLRRQPPTTPQAANQLETAPGGSP